MSRSNIDQLAKLDFKGKIDGLREKFQINTRQWFFDELSRWFADEESRVTILTAGPGMGKSVCPQTFVKSTEKVVNSPDATSVTSKNQIVAIF